MGCQKAIAKQIVDQGGDYVLALKGNQGTWYAAVEQLFQTADDTASEESSLSYYETEEQQHGRGNPQGTRTRKIRPALRGVAGVKERATGRKERSELKALKLLGTLIVS
jgi:predicted transposase YbfD/YdcC